MKCICYFATSSSRFASSPNLKLLVAMIATPFCMNALQFWVTDNFIKKQGAESTGTHVRAVGREA